MGVNSGKIKVIIADDHNLFADGVAEILANDNSFDVIAKVSDGKKLIQTLNRLCPDIVLLDIQMPYMDGLKCATIIREEKPNIKIVLVSMVYDSHLKSFIEKNNLNGFIAKTAGAVEFKTALQQITKGETVFIFSKADAAPDEELLQNDNQFLKLFKLTKTEVEIIKLIADGDSTKIIAEKMHISYLTVESHRKNVLRKLKAKNMTQVVKYALKNKIIG